MVSMIKNHLVVGTSPIHNDGSDWSCVPSNFMANRQVPKFSLNNCAQSSKKTFVRL